MKNFEEMFIKEIRKKFQDKNSRMSMMLLMLEEVRLEKMQEKGKNISYYEAAETLTEEFNDVKDSIITRERKVIISDFMKKMEL